MRGRATAALQLDAGAIGDFQVLSKGLESALVVETLMRTRWALEVLSAASVNPKEGDEKNM